MRVNPQRGGWVGVTEIRSSLAQYKKVVVNTMLYEQQLATAQVILNDATSSVISWRTKRNDRTQVFGYNKSVAGKVTEAAKQKVTTLSIREKRTASGRYSVSQQKIDSLTSGKLSGINTPVPVMYNARLRCNGKTTAELYQWGAVKRVTKIEVGAQDRESEGFWWIRFCMKLWRRR